MATVTASLSISSRDIMNSALSLSDSATLTTAGTTTGVSSVFGLNTLTLTSNQKIAGGSTASVFTVPGNARTFGLNTAGIGGPPGVSSGNAASGEAFLGILVE